MDSILSIMQDDFFSDAPNDKFREVEKEEVWLLLYSLGYLSSAQDDPSEEELDFGIAAFRDEYKHLPYEVYQKYTLHKAFEYDPINEDELDLLNDLASLDGEFDLHDYDFDTIAKYPLLCRCLNFRLKSIILHDLYVTNTLTEETTKGLQKLERVCGIKADQKAIQLLGDLDDFSIQLIEKKTFQQKHSVNLVVVENKRDTQLERKFKNDLTQFKKTLNSEQRPKFEKLFTKKISRSVSRGRARFQQKWIDPARLRVIKNDEVNQLMIRLIQLKLWTFGIYSGKIDNELGPVSLQSVSDLLEFYHSSDDGERDSIQKELSTKNIVHFMGNGFWLINSEYIIKNILAELTAYSTGEEASNQTVSGELLKVVDEADTEEKKNRIFEEVNHIVKDEKREWYVKHAKKRGGKGFFKSVRRFFSRAIDKAKKVIGNITAFIKKVVNKIKAFFQWFKNGISMLIREIKKTFKIIKNAIGFLFGKRIIKTEKSGQSSIESDYDFDFDNVSVIRGKPSDELIEEHIHEVHKKSTDFEKTSDYLKVALKIAMTIIGGPIAWIKLGLKLIKDMAKTGFDYVRLPDVSL